MKRSAPLKRTPFARKAPQPWARPERPAQPLYRLARPCPQARISQEATPVRKTVRVESEAYRRLVAALPCAHCGIQGYSQAAHPNTGKAKGMKADDRLCFPLCADRPGVVGCHFRFDQHQLFARPERAAIETKWASQTAAQIIAAGSWPAKSTHPWSAFMKKQGKKFKGKVMGLTPVQRIGMNATAAPELWAYSLRAAACGASVAAVDDRLGMALPASKAVQALIASRATREDWARVSKIAYALIYLRRQGVISKNSTEALETISQAIDTALKRQSQTRSNVLTPAEVEALEVLNAAWIDAIDATEVSKLVDASEYATRRLSQEYRTARHPKALALEVCSV